MLGCPKIYLIDLIFSQTDFQLNSLIPVIILRTIGDVQLQILWQTGIQRCGRDISVMLEFYMFIPLCRENCTLDSKYIFLTIHRGVKAQPLILSTIYTQCHEKGQAMKRCGRDISKLFSFKTFCLLWEYYVHPKYLEWLN